MLADVVGVEMSLGSVATCCTRVSTALTPVYEALVETLPQQPVVYVDETRWNEADQCCWLWVVVGAAATVFRIAASRGKQVWQGMLGDDYAGILTSDRLSAYNAPPAGATAVVLGAYPAQSARHRGAGAGCKLVGE